MTRDNSVIMTFYILLLLSYPNVFQTFEKINVSNKYAFLPLKQGADKPFRLAYSVEDLSLTEKFPVGFLNRVRSQTN